MNNLKLSVLFHVMIRDGTDISKHRYYPFDIAVRYYIEATLFFFFLDQIERRIRCQIWLAEAPFLVVMSLMSFS